MKDSTCFTFIRRSFLPCLWLALHNAKCPTIGTFHTYFDRSLWYSLLKNVVQKKFVDKLDGQIAISQSSIDALVPFFKLNARIIPNGVDITEFSPDILKLPRFDDGKKNLLFLGRLDPRNGFSLMVKAFEIIKSRFPEIRLIIVGDGPLRKYYRRLVPERLVRDIHLVGPILEERNRYYATCDIFCSPVEKASFGVTLLEAMASGKPIVATENSGYREILGREEGVLVSPRDPAAFAEAVLEILRNPAHGEEIGINGRQKALRYSWDNVIGCDIRVLRGNSKRLMILKIIASHNIHFPDFGLPGCGPFSHLLAFFSVGNHSHLVFDLLVLRSHPCLWRIRASLADLRTGILERKGGPQPGGPDLR